MTSSIPPPPSFPVKTREMHNHHFDSLRWKDFPFRDTDIIVTTAYKSGTTWTQNILVHLLHQEEETPSPESTFHAHPWLDLRFPPIEVALAGLEAETARRHFKSHLRLDALEFSSKAKYIYIGRDGRDCYMSLVNHYRSGNDTWYHMLNGPGLVGPPIPRFSEEEFSEKLLFDRWISEGWPSLDGETDGWPFWSLFDHVATWWQYRHLPNILFLHYADMLADTEGAIREIAAFLDVPIKEERLPEILQAVSLEGMRNNLLCLPAGMIFSGGATAFVNKGQNQRWRGVLSEEQLGKYDAKVREKLSPECAAWLENGKSGFNPKDRPKSRK